MNGALHANLQLRVRGLAGGKENDLKAPVGSR